MTLRELLTKSLEHCEGLDQEVHVRIVKRNEHDSLDWAKVVPITRVSTYVSGGKLCFNVEMSDVIQAKLERD